jgi:hypothetical protein
MARRRLETAPVNHQDIKTAQFYFVHTTEVKTILPGPLYGFVKRMNTADPAKVVIDQMVAELVNLEKFCSLQRDEVRRRDIVSGHYRALAPADRTIASAAARNHMAAEAKAYSSAMAIPGVFANELSVCWHGSRTVQVADREGATSRH